MKKYLFVSVAYIGLLVFSFFYHRHVNMPSPITAITYIVILCLWAAATVHMFTKLINKEA